jgi:predicted GNAT family N-acyltransferase
LVGVDDERIEIRWAIDSDDLSRAVQLRKEVFCEEQGVPPSEELDGRDGEAEHLVALADEGRQVVGTLRLLRSGTDAKVGRVAVARAWRRRGLASRMLALALARAREHGCTRARLAAQTEAVALYEQAGFAVESGLFHEAGIPHVWMGQTLSGR